MKKRELRDFIGRLRAEVKHLRGVVKLDKWHIKQLHGDSQSAWKHAGTWRDNLTAANARIAELEARVELENACTERDSARAGLANCIRVLETLNVYLVKREPTSEPEKWMLTELPFIPAAAEAIRKLLAESEAGAFSTSASAVGS